MKNTLTLILLLLFVSVSRAQDFKFGKVSKEELQEKEHPTDPSANAAVLYKNENISFTFSQSNGFTQQREVHERIKIYNKEGYDWATKKVFLFQGSSGSSKESIRNVKGYTFNLDGSKVNKEKLRNDGIFEEEYNDFTDITTLTMPNVQDGSVLEYTYTISSPFYQIDDIELQKSIPINKLDVRIATPQFLKYNRLNNPNATYFPNVNNSREKKSYVITSSSRSGGGNMTASSTTFNRSKDFYFEDIITLADDNVPAIKEEAFAGNMDNFKSKMTLELVAFLNEFGAIDKSFSTTWEKVSKTIYDRESFGDQIKRTNFFKDDIINVTSGAENDFQKAAMLSNFIKSKVKWDGYYGISTIKGTKDAYKEGSGNVAEINLLLIAMLKSQGVNANPVLVSTKNHGIPLYPTRKGFNYVICMVEDAGKYVLVDATEKFSSLNVLPERAINWQGRLIKDDGSSSWVSLMPSKQSMSSSSLNISINDDLSISGKVGQVHTDNLALSYKDRYANVSNDDKVKMFEKDKGDIEISDIEIETMDNNSLSVNYKYELNDAIDDIGGKLYFSPLLFMAEKENPFKLDERKYPIDFGLPIKETYRVNIKIPEGYKIESLPQAEKMQYKEGAVAYTFVARQSGSYLQLSTELNLKTSIIDPADYTVFKEFYGKVVEKQAEKIVLTKI